jgi:hypothetical protein
VSKENVEIVPARIRCRRARRHQIDAVTALAMALEEAERRPEPVELLGWL